MAPRQNPWSRVVDTQKDLPLEAPDGEIVVLRENENLYRFSAAEKKWLLHGAAHKLGQTAISDLSAHMESRSNPHSTTLAQAIEAGPVVQVQDAITLQESVERPLKSAMLTLLRTAAYPAVQIGKFIKGDNGLISFNGGPPGLAQLLLTVMDPQGTARSSLNSDGDFTTKGSVTTSVLGGSPAVEGDLEVRGGLSGLKGRALKILSGFALDGRAALTPEGRLGVGTDAPGAQLDVRGDVKITGNVIGDLTPAGASKLGTAEKPWETLTAKGALLVGAGLEASIPQGSKATRAFSAKLAGVETVAVSPEGDVTLAGEVAADHAALGPDDDKLEVGQIKDLGTALFASDNPSADWAMLLGNAGRDGVAFLRRLKDGEWATILGLAPNAAGFGGDVRVRGALSAAEVVATRFGEPGGSKNGLGFKAGEAVLQSVFSTFKGVASSVPAWRFAFSGGEDAKAPVLDVENDDGVAVLELMPDGTLRSDGALGQSAKPWRSVFTKLLSLGGVEIDSAGLLSTKMFRLNVGSLGIPAQLVTLARETALTTDGQLALLLGKNKISISSSPTGAAVIADGRGVSLQGVREIQGRLGVAGDDLLYWEREAPSKGDDASLTIKHEGADESVNFVEFSANQRKVLALSGARASIASQEVEIAGVLHSRFTETFDLALAAKAVTDGSIGSVSTLNKLPKGAVVQTTKLEVLEQVEGHGSLFVGDASKTARFAGPLASLPDGAVIRGNNHVDRGLAEQDEEDTVELTWTAAPTKGKVRLTVYYVRAL